MILRTVEFTWSLLFRRLDVLLRGGLSNYGNPPGTELRLGPGRGDSKIAPCWGLKLPYPWPQKAMPYLSSSWLSSNRDVGKHDGVNANLSETQILPSASGDHFKGSKWTSQPKYNISSS
ncbi:hypothetical protein VTI74DRAFT_10505 [Chaetomium olivicolor]